MKSTITTLFIGLFICSFSQEQIIPNLSKVQLPQNGKNEMIISRTAYVSSMDTVLNIPNWVFENLKHDMLNNHDKPEQSTHGYPSSSEYRIDIGNSYYSTGYDHGHMCPKANFYWSQKAYDESFEMCNMAPQNGALNRGMWCRMESLVRKWAYNSDKETDFFVVTGCVTDSIIDTICINNDVKIQVPRYFYKVIVKKRKDEFLSGIAFVMENKDLDCETPFENYTVSIDEVEEMTGLNFFPRLSKSEEKKIESEKGVFNFDFRVSACFCGVDDTMPNLRTKKKCK